ncbi:MAG: SDR family oxidoreductase [Alphaproteobacteria bacterium]|nr:SDR family oxidoreductase [Alphaproteobacteria bacterium]
MRLKGKVAIVTGAGAGFGQGIAERFAEEGCAVVVNDVNAKAAKAVATGIVGNKGKALAHAADVTSGPAIRKMVQATLKTYGRLDILVNNAGVPQRNRPMLDVDEATFDRIFAVNVKSIYWTAMHAVPVMRRQGGGVIINTASTAGVRPRPGLVWYNASKGAVITMTKSMAVELAPEKIRVCALNPVAGTTQMLAEFMGGEDTPEMRAKFVASVPLGRLSTPRDIANAALYLASDEADFITGVCMEVDGGRCI